MNKHQQFQRQSLRESAYWYYSKVTYDVAVVQLMLFNCKGSDNK